MWLELPGSVAQRGRRQLVGAAAVASLIAFAVGVHLCAEPHGGRTHLIEAFAHLEAARRAEAVGRGAALDAAETALRRGIGALRVEPLALIGLSLIDPMRTQLGMPAPASPELTGLSERTALDHSHALLRRGRPDLALAWLDRLRRARVPHESLQQIQVFAEMWQSARMRADGR